ncbi:MAG: hypothetical protein CVV21_12055 [Candidatus Goldiibacteriota bacterium HGW-Goldbacteria-1]|nr:MAG: hypothetical protein CVV21_12055 [Candidatus Goldiibacteriota bacterium HGW-Goldbacteria-1]
MKKTIVISSFIAILFLITSCAGVISFRKPGTARVSKAAAGAEVKPVLFDDFERGNIPMTYSYANTQAAANMSKFAVTGDEKYNGSSSAASAYDTGTSSEWGCGAALASAYATEGYIDAAGRKFITAWVLAPENTTFYFFVNEAAANGGDGEYWNSPSQTGAGKWAYYEIPFDEFFKNIYSGSQAGNNDLDPSAIGVIGVQLGGMQGKGTIYLDDIWLK